MNIVTMVTGLLAAAAVGALIVVAIDDDPTPVQEGPADTSRLESRLESLQAGMNRLETKVAMLENEQQAATALAAAPISDEVKPEIEETAPLAAASLDDDALKEKVLEVVKEKETADRESRAERRKAMEETREKERLNRLEKELNLDAYQKAELGRILAERSTAMRKIREKMFSGDGRPDPSIRDAIHEEFSKVRDTANEEIQNILSTDQFEQFQATDRSRGPGGGRGRGGGGR